MRPVLLLLLLLVASPSPVQAQTPSTTPRPMTILVHITHGPEAPTRAALGFHVAKAAIEEGHSVAVFLAGDAVQLLRESTIDQLTGLGTGKLREIYDALVTSGVRFYLSGGSSQARGITQAELEGRNVQFASPRDLVRLATEHDRMFTY
jgi:uncharacterized protein